jgi:hypothetical protein
LAPVADALGSEDFVNDLKARFREGSRADCLSCTVVVSLFSERDNPAALVLGECTGTIIRGVFGAPTGCRALYVEAGLEKWVRVISGVVPIDPPSMGRIDLSIAVAGPSLDISAIQKTIEEALSARPFELATQRADTLILGTASYRPSPILSGFREIVTVRVDAHMIGSDVVSEYTLAGGTPVIPAPQVIGVELYTTFYVNKQNTNNPEDWHLPSEPQSQIYLDKLKTGIKASIVKTCKKAVWLSEAYLYCS